MVLVHFFDERKFFVFFFMSHPKKACASFSFSSSFLYKHTRRSKNLNSPLLGERCIVSYIIKKTRNTLSSLVLLSESPS